MSGVLQRVNTCSFLSRKFPAMGCVPQEGNGSLLSLGQRFNTILWLENIPLHPGILSKEIGEFLSKVEILSKVHSTTLVSIHL